MQLAVELDAEQSARLEPLLEEAGAISVSYLDPGGDPILEPPVGSSPLWARVKLLALFLGWPDADQLYAHSCVELGVASLPGWRLAPLEQRCWERAWMDHYHPMRFGQRLWVVPTNAEPPQPQAVNLRLDPGLAFGTGTHPTTALCLEWLDGSDLTGRRVVDFGCGSGILAIAALLLGAESAIGIDNDPQALYASRENAERNGVADALELWAPEQVRPVQADVVVANILAGVLIDLAGEVVQCLAPGGAIALSGILDRQAEDVRSRYRQWIDWSETREHDGWVCLVGRRR
jgi:ribosomal protein L11 methyltransferase